MLDIKFCKNESPRECTTVRAEISTDLPIKKGTFIFTFEATYQFTAELLMQHLNKCLDESIENAHSVAYEQGWQDAKRKKRKKKEFVYTFTNAQVGY